MKTFTYTRESHPGVFAELDRMGGHGLEQFELDAKRVAKEIASVHRHHPNRDNKGNLLITEQEKHDVAVAQAAYVHHVWTMKAKDKGAEIKIKKRPLAERYERSRAPFWVGEAIKVAIVLLLILIAVRHAHAQVDSLHIQSGGSDVKSWAGGVARLNFPSNMTCSFNGATKAVDCTPSGAVGSVAWSALTAPGAGLSLAHGANATTFTWNAATGAGTDMFTFADTLNNTGTGYILRVNLASGSAAKPFSAAVNGNGVSVSNLGVLSKLGTGQVNADHYNGNALVAVADGGTGLATLAAHQLYLGNGTSAPTPIPSGTNGQLLQSLGAGADPGFADPIVSGPDAVGATATKNPVQVGCLFNTTPATITNGQVGAAQCDSVQNILVNVKSSALPSGAAADSSLATIDTDLKANIVLAAGTHVIGHVIADTGSTTAVTGNVAVTIADAADTTLGAKADAKSAATDTTAVTIMQVLKQISASVQSPPSQAVTNAGTFADQATLQTQTDTTMVGGVNVKEINGVAPLMGNGTTGAGSQRVTIASDNTAFAVNATLQAGSALAGEVAPVATATTTDSALACNILSAASTNATNCKGSAGNFYGYEIYNTTTTVYYLRLYNTSSSPTCSSATGFIRSIPIQPAGAAGGVGGSISNQGFAVGYSTGISFCLTGGSSSTDNTNAAVGIFGEIRYK